MGTIYLLSPITVISLKAIDLNNRGWNVVTPSDRMLSIILAESEHLDNLGGTSALRYKVLACSEVVSLPVAEGVASLHPRLLKLSPPATILYAVNKPISSTGDNRYIVPKNYFWPKALRFSNRFLLDFSRSDLKECCQAEISTQIHTDSHRFTQIF